MDIPCKRPRGQHQPAPEPPGLLAANGVQQLVLRVPGPVVHQNLLLQALLQLLPPQLQVVEAPRHVVADGEVGQVGGYGVGEGLLLARRARPPLGVYVECQVLINALRLCNTKHISDSGRLATAIESLYRANSIVHAHNMQGMRR